MSCIMRTPAFCICENKGADQLRSACAADQCLYFHYIDSAIPLLSKTEISSLLTIFCGRTAPFVSDLVRKRGSQVSSRPSSSAVFTSFARGRTRLPCYARQLLGRDFHVGL